MTSGVTPKQADMWRGSASMVDGRVAPDSIWALLHRDGHRLFPDEMFADLFSDRGRRSVPPQIVATVMVLQKCFGRSDREAVEAFAFDMRWKYACGVDLDYPGFAHTVLVDMRARLARSVRPERIFEVTLAAAHGAGLVGHRRVLDSTPLYDAVATMDTITLVRSAVRGLLKVAGPELEAELRGRLSSGDDYRSLSKPVIDWDDRGAREALIDSRALDAVACLVLLAERPVTEPVAAAVALVATVVGQDLDWDADGVFRIRRGVAADRVISTVDPQARHGHKTQAHAFDGYKAHAAEDPDSELITATTVTPGNVGDAAAAPALIGDLLSPDPAAATEVDGRADGPEAGDPEAGDREAGDPERAVAASGKPRATNRSRKKKKRRQVYGDAAYGSGEFQKLLEENDLDSGCKTQKPAPPPGGLFSKDHFTIDLDAGTVTCPNAVTVTITPRHRGGIAQFAPHCATCPQRPACTRSRTGRQITIHEHEAVLARARTRQTDPAWQADYRATRPKVERKLGHLMRYRHGGRRARVRGLAKVAADFNLLAAAVNLARLATLGLHHEPTGWAT